MPPARSDAMIANTTSFKSVPPPAEGMRSAFAHGPLSMNATGLPPSAAASIRSGRSEPGHVPVHAARVSEASRKFHNGASGFSPPGSISAARKSGAQSTFAVLAGWSIFCAGMARNSSRRPCGSRLHEDHPRGDLRRVVRRRQSQGQQIIVKRDSGKRLVALAIPVAQHRRAAPCHVEPLHRICRAAPPIAHRSGPTGSPAPNRRVRHNPRR